MSTYGESAGVHTAGEGVFQTADDSDPLPARGRIYQSTIGPIAIQERAWEDPSHDDASQEDYGRLIEHILLLDLDARSEQARVAEREAIIRLTALADEVLSTQHDYGRRAEVRTERARLVRERLTVPAFDVPLGDEQSTVMKEIDSYFFVDYEQELGRDENDMPQYYCRNWSSDADKVTFCQRIQGHEPADAVSKVLLRQLGEQLPQVNILSQPRPRRFNLRFLLKSPRPVA